MDSEVDLGDPAICAIDVRTAGLADAELPREGIRKSGRWDYDLQKMHKTSGDLRWTRQRLER